MSTSLKQKKYFSLYFFLAIETENDYEVFLPIIFLGRPLTLGYLVCGAKNPSVSVEVFYAVNKSSRLCSELIPGLLHSPTLFISGFNCVLNPVIYKGFMDLSTFVDKPVYNHSGALKVK